VIRFGEVSSRSFCPCIENDSCVPINQIFIFLSSMIAHLRTIVDAGKARTSGIVQLIIVSERSARADARGVTTARLGDYNVRHDYANRHVPTLTTTTTTTMTTMTTTTGKRETHQMIPCVSSAIIYRHAWRIVDFYNCFSQTTALSGLYELRSSPQTVTSQQSRLR